MINNSEMYLFTLSGYPELLRRQSSQWTEDMNISRCDFIVEWPNQDLNYAKLDDFKWDFKSSDLSNKLLELDDQPSFFKFRLEHQDTVTSIDNFLEYPWYQQQNKSEIGSQFEESGFDDALENHFRQMIDDEEPIVDSSPDK